METGSTFPIGGTILDVTYSDSESKKSLIFEKKVLLYTEMIVNVCSNFYSMVYITLKDPKRSFTNVTREAIKEIILKYRFDDDLNVNDYVVEDCINYCKHMGISLTLVFPNYKILYREIAKDRHVHLYCFGQGDGYGHAPFSRFDT